MLPPGQMISSVAVILINLVLMSPIGCAAEWDKKTVGEVVIMPVGPPGMRIQVEATLFVTRNSVVLSDTTFASDIKNRESADVLFERCEVFDKDFQTVVGRCDEYIAQKLREAKIPSGADRQGIYLVFRSVFRGKAVTLRSGVKKDEVRLGFGHLNSFPAQIVISEMIEVK